MHTNLTCKEFQSFTGLMVPSYSYEAVIGQLLFGGGV